MDGERGERGGSRARTVLRVGGVVGLVGLLTVGYALLSFRQNWFPFHSAKPREVTLDEARRRFLRERVLQGPDGRPFTPAAGVYEYQGSGTESLSNPPRSQPEGPNMPGTVTIEDDGCWSFRLDYSTNHFRSWRFCADASELVQVGSVVSQRWDFGTFAVENVTTLSCSASTVVLTADMTPGEKWPARCRGESTQVEGTTVSVGSHRLVAVERMRVGDASVEAYHFRDRRTVTGAQSGTEQFDFWLSRDGLILRGEQRISVDSDSPIGNVTYTQESAFSLVTAVPQA